MEAKRFNDIATSGQQQLAALLSPFAGVRGGTPLFYNAYFNGTEVVVLGYQYEEGGTTFTKPVAIMVDDEVFEKLRVDDESARNEGGQVVPKKVV